MENTVDTSHGAIFPLNEEFLVYTLGRTEESFLVGNTLQYYDHSVS